MKYEIRVNEELEGWDIIELGGIETEEGKEDAVLATFYNHINANAFLHLLNSNFYTKTKGMN